MKTHSSFFARFSLAAIAIVVLVTAPTYAISGSSTEESTEPSVKKTVTTGQSVFCKSFDTLVSKTSTEVRKRGDTSNGLWSSSASEIQKKREQWQAKLTTMRAEAATRRLEQFAKLDELGKTDAQKTAIATYKQTILAAVATRQAAHDANLSAYFAGVDALLATQKANSSTDVSGMNSKVLAAINKAKASCASGASADTVKNQLSTELKAARESFKTERQTDSSGIKKQLEQLRNTRKEANQKANDTFKATHEAARAELKAAFEGEDI